MSASEDHLLFIEDANGQLDACDKSVLALDAALMAGQAPGAADLNTLFRGVHTLKGNAGMVECERLVEVAHVLETLMDQLRGGTLALTRELVDVIFAGLDTLRTLVLMFQAGTADAFDAAEFLRYLHAAMQQGPAAGARLQAMFPGLTLHDPATHEPQLEDLDAGHARVFRLIFALADADPSAPIAHEAFEKLTMLGFPLAWRWLEPGRLELAYLTRADAEIVTRFGPVQLTSCAPWEMAASAVIPQAPAAPALAPSEPAAEGAAGAEPGEAPLRVSVGLLDKLMNLVGELVLTRNQILQHTAPTDDPAATAPVQRLSQLTTELQEAVMKTRMQTIGQIWDKFPRLVRDYGRSSGKQIQLVQTGAETELDKSLLEAIKDPLTHLVRNALDHGLEPAEARVAAGKPALGTLTLSAEHAGGHILLTIRDDGRGLDLERIKEKALAQGLVSQESLGRMSVADIQQLILAPGFSTAEAVTNMSGRGVGMDVVKSNIERIGGGIDIQSEPGRGTRMRLRIPLTLAVMPALVITAHGQRFALPQSAVQEVVALAPGQASLEHVGGSLVFRLRQALIPVVPLRRALGLEEAEARFLVVIQAGAGPFGLAVDAIGDTQEIVVKPTPTFLHGLDTYAGVTLLGDGQACMILNAASLGAGFGPEVSAPPAPEREAGAAGARRRLLLVKLAGDTFAIPMERVSRLETLPAEQLERLGERLVLQYGDRLLNVIEPALALSLPAEAPAETAQVVVLGEGAAMKGLRVDEILDIADEVVDLHPLAGMPGVVGAAVIGGVATRLLDIESLLANTHPVTEALR